MKILVLSGPNLNLLGTREPHIYGTTTLADIERDLEAAAAELGVTVECVQSNHEGVLIDRIQAAHGDADGIIINAGAYSHTSLAIRDALSAVAIPYAEVHLSNIFAREPERRHSTLAAGARAVLCGFGAPGYALALRGLVAALRA
ncbi:MAG: type II 3-dehydroquinate dehydratase [Gemmatimonadaceae bacterium]